MPTLNYSPIPSVAPDPSRSVGFQTERATPQAFGALEGAALEQLGQRFEQAGDVAAKAALERQVLFNQVAADEAGNALRDTWNKRLYGDPNVPGDTGFYGKHGKDAMTEYPNVRKDLDQMLRDSRAQLQNDNQRHLFDSAIRREHSFLMNETGRHYDRQFNTYAENTAKASSAIAEQDMSAAAIQNDRARLEQAMGTKILKETTELRRLGASEEQIKAATIKTMALGVKLQAEAMAANGDAEGALRFVRNNLEHVNKDEGPDLINRLKAKADAQILDRAISGEKVAPGTGGGLVHGGAVDQLQGGATRNLPLAKTVNAQLERAATAVGDLKVEVYSGGQPSSGPNRTGSHRHDEGGAADVQLRDVKTGQLLDMRKPEDQARMAKFISEAVRAGATGVGAAEGYMGPHGIHIGGGKPGTWGAGGSGATTPSWVKAAYVAGQVPGDVVGGSLAGDLATLSKAGLLDVSAKPDTLVRPIPPRDDPSFPPDEQVPGLLDAWNKASKNIPSDRADLLPALAKKLRTEMNAAYTDQQHARRQAAQASKDYNEEEYNKFVTRMAPSSTNVPTADEILTSGMTAEMKLATYRALQQATKKEPMSNVSYPNEMELYQRIHAKDNDPRKIYGAEVIRDAYAPPDGSDGKITWQARDRLLAGLKEVQGAKDSEITKHVAEALVVATPKLWPAIVQARGNKEVATRLDPAGAERVMSWKMAVDAKKQQYIDENKNPRDLFVKGNKDYVLGEEFLAQFPVPKLPAKIDPNAPKTEPATVDPATLMSKEEVDAAFTKKQITPAQARARALELGYGLPAAPTGVVPMAR